jgi:hypothetical protein
MVQKCPDVFFGQCFIGKTMMIISCGEVAYFQTNPHVASHVAVEVFQVWTSIQMGLSKIIGVPKIRWFRASSSLFIATNWNKLVGIYIYIHIYICIWEDYNDLTATSLESWLGFGKSSPNGRKIQVSELF